jgi:hypothetical protein
MLLEERTLAPHCVPSIALFRRICAVQCGVETIRHHKSFVYKLRVGLPGPPWSGAGDMAGEHRLLDQRNALEKKLSGGLCALFEDLLPTQEEK